MAKKMIDTRVKFDTGYGNQAYMYSLSKLEEKGFPNIRKLPFSIKILLESVLRECDDYLVNQEDIYKLANYDPKNPKEEEIPFKPARVILQDFTGVPVVVDLAAMRSAMKRFGGDSTKINPIVPVDLVIDHSVQVDFYGSNDALDKNRSLEFERNRERYEFLKWGQKSLKNFRVIPPSIGIIHQVNLEYLAKALWSKDEDDLKVFYPDSLVGTDSHTTMINGLGILGWGVGGIEAEAVMLGQPIYMLIPEVIGFKLYGKLQPGVTATDLTLTIVQMLRKKGVVGKFVEFYGSGLSNISLPDRATIANMAPEYGATMGFFPIDNEALNYLRNTGRPEELVKTVENYMKLQGLFRTDDTEDPIFTDTLELDLSTVEPSLAGPKRPQDRVSLSKMKEVFRNSLTDTKGFNLNEEKLSNFGIFKEKEEVKMKHGDVVIAAITSCTNTSNPSVLIGAGLLAKKAVEKGLKVKPYVKTSLAPGSRVVTEYLNQTGLTEYLDKLGFNTVGYGCTTCIGNSGPIKDEVESAIKEGDLIVASVLSGNRNFEGRIHPSVKANYLASPPLVVAYAIAGTVDIDLTKEPLGIDNEGKEVYLKDIWPSNDEINSLLKYALDKDVFKKMYDNVEFSNKQWNEIPVVESDLFNWNEKSTYIQEPPFFENLSMHVEPIKAIKNARLLAKLGDSITTDHISPAGSIKKDSPAGKYLIENGVDPKDFNSYGSRRGNDKVMTRGTFANIRLKNLLLDGIEGGYTLYFPENKVEYIYDAAMKYKAANIPLGILAGKEYGTGSSRDWAAKGTYLLGVKFVIAESFERIHRANLVGMGVLPLQFKEGENYNTLGLKGDELFDILIDDNLKPKQEVKVIAKKENGEQIEFKAICRIDTPVEIDYYRNGGILQTVLRNFIKN
ncbi:MAG: aconitate hydratase A [Candidatus Sericytochromatia bacterium]|nr:MAG: aconitate hydratase A [Candidatus Sericytochromatia bacterium]